jgi:hypothetical protein
VIKAPRELKMTIICPDPCGNQYGAWRPHCPVCQRATPKTHYEAAVTQSSASAVGGAPVRKLRERTSNECIFCYRRKAKDTCPHCNEPIHTVCRGVHEPDCKAFQAERVKALAAAGVTA